MRAAKSPSYSAWSGYSFEGVCYKHIRQVQRALRINSAHQIGSWRHLSADEKSDGTQIDLLIDRDDGVVSLCEIKYSDQPFIVDKKYHRNLLNNVQVYQAVTKTQKHILLALISANGMNDNIYSSIFTRTVTLEDFSD